MKTRKEKLLDGLDLANMIGSEIGPLHNPLVSKSLGHVIYIDHTDAESLRKHYAKDPKVNPNDIHVDAIWGVHTLKQAIDGYFIESGGVAQAIEYVVASHVIEHVPDVVTWLQEIRSVLRTDGQVRLAIPDKRFTFDHLRRTTNLTDVMVAYLTKARIPNTHCLLDFCLNESLIDVATALQGNFEKDFAPKQHSFEGALSVARDALHNGTYHDVHCWVFTPASFADLMGELSRNGLVDFACVEFYDTEANDNEFIVNLRICDNAFERQRSWHQMASLAHDHGKDQSSGATEANVPQLDPVLL